MVIRVSCMVRSDCKMHNIIVRYCFPEIMISTSPAVFSAEIVKPVFKRLFNEESVEDVLICN